jgi:DNA-binding response OmpR family regulator
MGRILVVEDDPSVQKALKRLFETEGYAVEVQNNGKSALESFQAAPPAVIILDLRLPKLSGSDLCKEIKAQAPTALPIVVSQRNQRCLRQGSAARTGCGRLRNQALQPQRTA